MTNITKKQILVIHTHTERKLFHVSMHNFDSKTGFTWKAVASKAKYVYDKVLTGDPKVDGRVLTAGFAIAMVNTNYEGWETVEYPGEHDLNDAINFKEDLIDQYEEQGYTNVGVRSVTNKRDPSNDRVGSKWAAPFAIDKMTKAKIDEKIEWINTSLQLNIPQSVKNSAYLSTVRTNGKVHDMATLLCYIRKEMELD